MKKTKLIQRSPKVISSLLWNPERCQEHVRNIKEVLNNLNPACLTFWQKVCANVFIALRDSLLLFSTEHLQRCDNRCPQLNHIYGSFIKRWTNHDANWIYSLSDWRQTSQSLKCLLLGLTTFWGLSQCKSLSSGPWLTLRVSLCLADALAPFNLVRR